jgi:hypothetical protein
MFMSIFLQANLLTQFILFQGSPEKSRVLKGSEIIIKWMESI